jgi:hypothetical protein
MHDFLSMTLDPVKSIIMMALDRPIAVSLATEKLGAIPITTRSVIKSNLKGTAGSVLPVASLHNRRSIIGRSDVKRQTRRIEEREQTRPVER